ncbi:MULTISPECIES: conjugal transfer protein [Mycobacteriaceae]|uniref:conjugal transfer protein n=1 Tax=Mycobacteriaceae TaxID=1762 RepID=UPI001CD9E343|nr:conjugal transfer protein [Mycobacterium sp. WUMAC-067]MCA2243428.1 conjugal transfer protein [Mycobacterium sp. WUMAC-067]
MPTKTWQRRIDTTGGWIGRAFFIAAVASCSIVALSTIWGWIFDHPIDVHGPARKEVNRTELVGNFARQCVEKALTVTNTQRASLQSCWANQDQQQPLPTNPGAVISSPGVAAVTLEDDLGYAQQWSVIVSVSERPYAAAPAAEKCYRIPVLYSSYGLQATSRPGKADCAGAGATLPLGYPTTLSNRSPVFHTLTGFFESYLTNTGGLDRYITEKSGLVAVPDYRSARDGGPAPRIVKLQSTRAVPDDAMPADGTTIHVFATVDSVTRQFSPRREDYALSLTVISGRWMVAGIDYAPQLASQAELTPVVPAPTKGQS